MKQHVSPLFMRLRIFTSWAGRNWNGAGTEPAFSPALPNALSAKLVPLMAVVAGELGCGFTVVGGGIRIRARGKQHARCNCIAHQCGMKVCGQSMIRIA